MNWDLIDIHDAFQIHADLNLDKYWLIQQFVWETILDAYMHKGCKKIKLIDKI